MTEPEPNDAVIGRLSETLAAAQSGALEGIVCVCFMANGAVNVQVAGSQNLITRLGALEVTRDAIKLLESQLQKQTGNPPINWSQAGNA